MYSSYTNFVVCHGIELNVSYDMYLTLFSKLRALFTTQPVLKKC